MGTQQPASGNGFIILFLVVLNVIIIESGYTDDPNWYKALVVTLPLLLLAIFNTRFSKREVYPDSEKSEKQYSRRKSDRMKV